MWCGTGGDICGTCGDLVGGLTYYVVTPYLKLSWAVTIIIFLETKVNIRDLM